MKEWLQGKKNSTPSPLACMKKTNTYVCIEVNS